MAKKLPKMNADQLSEPPVSSAVEDATQQIWLAGLGAFSKAQKQGSKAFEILVQEGLNMQRKTQVATQDGIAQASTLMNTMASDIQAQAEHRLDRLETIFEDRVAKALNRLGIPSRTQMDTLLTRLDQLEKCIHQLNSTSTDAAAPVANPASGAKTAPRRRKAVPQNARPASGEKSASTAVARSHPVSQLEGQSPAASKPRKVSKSG